MAKIITVTTSQAETAVDFGAYYQFAWVKNLSDDTDCYISDHSGASAEDDDVALVSAGSSAMIVTSGDTIYIIGSGVKCECRAQNFAECPFGDLAGESGGESITIDPTPTQGSSNAVSSGGVYTALQNVGGFTRTVLYDSGGYDTYAPFQTDVPLLDNLSNYDFAIVELGSPTDNTAHNNYIITTMYIDINSILNRTPVPELSWQGYQQRSIIFTLSDTKLYISEQYHGSEAAGYAPQIYKIYGYKFG